MVAMQEGQIRCTNLNDREHWAAESYVWLNMFLKIIVPRPWLNCFLVRAVTSLNPLRRFSTPGRRKQGNHTHSTELERVLPLAIFPVVLPLEHLVAQKPAWSNMQRELGRKWWREKTNVYHPQPVLLWMRTHCLCYSFSRLPNFSVYPRPTLNVTCLQTGIRMNSVLRRDTSPRSEKAPTVGPGVEVCNGLILPWLDSCSLLQTSRVTTTVSCPGLHVY